MAVFGLFFVTLVLSVYLVKWSVATIPVRAMFALAILCLVAADNVEIIFSEIRRFRFLLAVTVAVALIGALSSLYSDADLAVVGRQIIEIHVQAFINIIVGACVVRICGVGRAVFALVVVVAITSLFALLQFLGVGFAYQARNFLGSLQPVGPDADGSPYLEGRARGLSYTALQLGTQVCLVFAALFGFLLHNYGRKIVEGLDVRVLASAGFVAVVSVAAGNRSPIAGIMLFLAVYAWLIKSKRPVLLFTLVALVVVLFIDQLLLALQQLGLRVANTQDGSAISRNVLRVYGILLFLGQPFGYGLDFDSTAHASEYLGYLSGFERAHATMVYALHNYYLMMLNKYGILILIVAFFVARKLIRRGLIMVAFIPYMTHIFYHNDGPYLADCIIWFLIPVFSRIDRVALSKPVERGRVTPPRGRFRPMPRTGPS